MSQVCNHHPQRNDHQRNPHPRRQCHQKSDKGYSHHDCCWNMSCCCYCSCSSRHCCCRYCCYCCYIPDIQHSSIVVNTITVICVVFISSFSLVISVTVFGSSSVSSFVSVSCCWRQFVTSSLDLLTITLAPAPSGGGSRLTRSKARTKVRNLDKTNGYSFCGRAKDDHAYLF